MTREGLPTGQMQEETQELLDEYNEEYCWEYNDMVDFIKEHGEKDFREYYETYNRICEDYGKELVDAYDIYIGKLFSDVETKIDELEDAKVIATEDTPSKRGYSTFSTRSTTTRSIIWCICRRCATSTRSN